MTLKTAVLFSGGKDSCLALGYALEYTNVECLIIIISKNKESYMFHTPNIRWAEHQAKAIGIPAIVQKTRGVKERELKDLEIAIKKAKSKFKIEGIVTGAIASIYQASRVQAIADKLGIECSNPLWQKDQIELLTELIDKGFDVVIVGVFADGLDKFIGRKIDDDFIRDIKIIQEKYEINPAGEGGETESFVLNAPFFKKKLEIKKSHTIKDKEGCEILEIDDLLSKTK